MTIFNLTFFKIDSNFENQDPDQATQQKRIRIRNPV